MDESMQQMIALLLVAAVVVLEWLRRRRAKARRSGSCDGCGPGRPDNKSAAVPLKFYQRKR